MLASLPDGLPDALEAGRRGAALEQESFRTDILSQLICPLFTTHDEHDADAAERSVPLDQVEAELRIARSVILIGEPGAGKSSALAQIAELHRNHLLQRARRAI